MVGTVSSMYSSRVISRVLSGFSTPFVGAALSLLLIREAPESGSWLAYGLMALGVWLHVSENHEHKHLYMTMTHENRYVHHAHHKHIHDFNWDGVEPHSHPHERTPLVHTHTHFPDINHRHGHKAAQSFIGSYALD